MLDHLVRVCVISGETMKLFSKVGGPFCIPASNEEEYLLLYILFASIWCCQYFGILHSSRKLCLESSMPMEKEGNGVGREREKECVCSC